MAVGSGLGAVEWAKTNDSPEVIANSKTYITNLVGEMQNRSLQVIGGGRWFAPSLDGSNDGFIGVSESGMTELTNQINTYCNNIEAHINQFATEKELEIAFKGEIKVAAVNFVESIKKILQAYVSLMRHNINEVNEAYQNYKKGDVAISGTVTSDADQIRANAESVHFN